MKRLWSAACGCLLAGAVMAAGPGAVRRQVEASMVVTGTLVVAPDGSVGSYRLDRPERLPAPVVDLIGRNVPRWKFEPVVRDGKPVAAKARMSLRVVARPIEGDDQNYALSIRGTHFGDAAGSLGFKEHRQGPHYPEMAARGHVEGTVYLLLKVDRQGKVVDAVAQQVNLAAIGSEHLLQAWREAFAKSALQAARTWTFNVSADGEDAETEFHYARVPVHYQLGERGQLAPDPYGRWEVYVPGPYQAVPWFDKEGMISGVDALPDDGLYDVGHPGPVLLTPPGGA